jgi:CCR4-NOT transcription complex subunit 7/8
MNEKGELPPNRDIWQFNMHFNLGEDMYSDNSVQLLKEAGFDFTKHQVKP